MLSTTSFLTNVKTIGSRAFKNCSSITDVFANKLVSIGKNAFEGCYKLKTVYTGKNLSSIGSKVFYGCDAMSYFVCKNPDASIGLQALGYDHMRNYTGKKTIFTLWGSNGGGTVRTYAKNNDLTYKNTEDAPSEAIEKFSA